MSSNNFREDEEDEEGDMLLENKNTNTISGEQVEGSEIPFCGFLSVRFYKPYFDVDTKDITTRLNHALLKFSKDDSFMSLIAEKPDAYGPFWISTSLIFAVAVSSHISSFLSAWMKGKEWVYDFQAFLTLASIVYSFSAIVPLIIWFGLRQFNAKLKLITTLCLYGYSLIFYIPISLMCIFPSQFFAWLLFIAGGTLSTLFLLRNLAPVVVAHAAQNAAVLLGILGAMQFIFTLTLKLNFQISV